MIHTVKLTKILDQINANISEGNTKFSKELLSERVAIKEDGLMKLPPDVRATPDRGSNRAGSSDERCHPTCIGT